MTIPPFPAQDLAKLVLGYLAEEQLMTAYDEFLQASPYLDAMKNEYDRIFMTSLKSILAEYRAVKIFVETCKPVALRRRLYGCNNLLDVIKFLVHHVDVTKLGSDTSTHKSRIDSRSQIEQKLTCERCDSRQLNCICKSRHSLQPSPNADTNALESSVETTPLNDLPGNHVTVRRKQVKVLERDKESLSQSTCNSSSGDIVELSSRKQMEGTSNNLSTHSSHSSQNIDTPSLCNASVRAAETMDSSQKLDEFNDILNKVCNKSTGTLLSSKHTPSNVAERVHKVPYEGTFHNFSTGATASANDTTNANVPDSSTSENYNVVTPISKETNSNSNPVASNLKEVTKAHILFKVGTVKNSQAVTYPGKIKPKPVEQKITILSDIKVDKQMSRDSSPMPEVLRNATSTPVMRMQTILINGTPAFRQVQKNDQSKNFTKDEIMAMPTIIIVPSSSTETTSVQSQAQTTVPPTNTVMTSMRSLEPLVIDVNPLVPNNNDAQIKPNESIEDIALLKTVHGKHFSLPKDSVITTESSNKATPQAQPPVRKSSSTPRRTSHVRVLDFATPRRILDDAIDERDEAVEKTTDIVVSRSPNLHKFIGVTSIEKDTAEQKVETSRDQECVDSKLGPAQENNNTSNGKKCNWDEGLRALAIANNDGFKKTIPLCQRKEKQTKKRDKSNDKKKTQKSKKRKSEEVTVVPVTLLPDIISIPVKPTINIVTGPDRNIPESNKSQFEQNKSNEEPSDTPDMDRTSLQNIIGAKLNISELLETPYKQALYDIQMETPRFLGPDLPGEPLSDIKIMNIPTPRFLSSPKQVQATPSSYSSRPTDYSSGGSYYKPDDQDYLALEEIGYPKQSLGNIKQPQGMLEPETEGVRTRSSTSRPVRKCTKNVSYYNSPAPTKPKEVSKDTSDDKDGAASPYSDSISVNSSFEFEKQKESKSTSTKTYTRNKPTKTVARVKKWKSPIKKDTPKSFMKIKPRRPTPPSKDTARKNRRKTPESQPRKRTNSKEKMESATPAIISAPTKSRRKSSTPRKLHCTKTFNSGDYSSYSPVHSIKGIPNIQNDNSPDSLDAELEKSQTLKDDRSKGADSKEQHANTSVLNDSEDINQIKEFIATSETVAPGDLEKNLHLGLVNRGFDVETAKIIERDLLDTPLCQTEIIDVVRLDTETTEIVKELDIPLEKTAESSAASSTLQIVQEEGDDECDEIELTVHECNEDTVNYIICNHDETEKMPKLAPVPLKDKFFMEVCIDDDIAVKLRATPFTVLLDQDPVQVERIDYSYRETEIAVSSISDIQKLYTPLKESIKAQCYEIFDSTLTSLDTPLKATSPKTVEHETSVTGIVLEIEEVGENEKKAKKRKRRISSEEDSTNEHKKSKPEAQYLLNPANIQNIDIESVLCKLHGP